MHESRLGRMVKHLKKELRKHDNNIDSLVKKIGR